MKFYVSDRMRIFGMLTAVYMLTANTVFVKLVGSCINSSHPISVLITRQIKLTYSFFLICILLSVICLSAHSLQSTEDEVVIDAPSDFTIESTQNSPTYSSHTFSYEDVYKLELNLNMPGDVRIIAIDTKTEDKSKISVSLEKRVHQEHPLINDIYLTSITLLGGDSEGVLKLRSHLPDRTFIPKKEEVNPFDVKKHVRLNYTIKTPPDISVQLNVLDGNVYLHHIRGKIEVTTNRGNIHLDETLGNYQVEVMHGRIHGNILLAPGQNNITTQNGSIHLTFLDALSSPLNITAVGGEIRLLLPVDYAADVELESDKKQYIINIPAEVENNSGNLNGGGPLLRLTSTDTISLLQNPNVPSLPKNTDPSRNQEVVVTSTLQPIPITTRSPVIDGKLSDKAWSNAIPLTAFRNPTGTEKAENATDVYLMWDHENLYIGVRAHFTSYQVPRVSQTQKDSPIWNDESVEILLDTNPETESYSHIIVNPIGAYFDQWVKSVGHPPISFYPDDITRKSKDDSTEQFKGDSKWNSNAKVSTQIYTNFWSFELAYPYKAIGKARKGNWLFNIHRKAQGKLNDDGDLLPTVKREYSYWLPVYDEEYPWWPHWKEGMGRLELQESQPSVAQPFEISESYEVITIEIEGNKTIPTEIIFDYVPTVSGDILTNDQLTWLIAELETIDLFKEVQLRTVVLNAENSVDQPVGLSDTTGIRESSIESDDQTAADSGLDEPLPVILQINITEAPIQDAKSLSIIGNKNFPTHFIKTWFDLSVGYSAVTNVELKQNMIRDFYLNRGFPFTEVTHKYVRDSLQINVNEGYLDEIRFTGNRQLSNAELISALDIDTEDVYYHSLGQTRIKQFDKKLRKNNVAFKSISNWEIQREGGKNVLIIEIEEEPFLTPGWHPIVGFNRVHGVVLGADGTLSTHFTGEEQLFGSISLGFASRIWNYHFGIEKSFFRRYPLSTGFGFYKLTDISSNDYRLLPTETNLSAAVYGTAFEDYFQRQGQQIWIAQRFGFSSLLRLEFTQENYDNLSKSTDWSYFNRGLIKRGNLRIDTGHIKMMALRYTFDTRDHKSTLTRTQSLGSNLLPWPNERTKRGWRGHFGIEVTGGTLGGDYSFNLYRFEVIRYTPIIGPSYLNIRLSGAFSDKALPTQHLLYLGGATTLRGYNFNRFAGDKRILLNVEYRIAEEYRFNNNENSVYGWAISTFMDTGRVWWHDENPIDNFSFNQLNTSVGFGFSFFMSPPAGFQPFSIAAEIAQPINTGNGFQLPVLIWRLERIF